MIYEAATNCGVSAVKFQKRKPTELLSEEEYNSPHPVPANSYGETYGEHREFLEFSIEQHKELSDYCNSLGVDYSCSVWDLTSAAEISSLSPKFIKVPSACNLNKELLGYLLEKYTRQIHISLGMTTMDEAEMIFEYVRSYKREKDIVFYSCTSGYPVRSDEICLLEIERLKQNFGSYIGSVGFSGHHIGVVPDIAAYTLGAKYIERHFTISRSWKGTDHSASLEPSDLKFLVESLKSSRNALSLKADSILEVESTQRFKLKRKPN